MDNDTYNYMTNLSDETSRVDLWNDELARGLILNDVILSLYILLGIFGNATVIFIYGLKMKGKTEDRYFIPYLAVSDLCASTVCASFGIALNMMQAKFDNFRLCKAWWFFAAFTTFMSIMLLVIIAVHRYLKICKPLGQQMTLKWKRFAMLLAVLIAFALSVPMTMFYGSVPFPNIQRGITGLRCSKIKGENKTGSLIFGAVVGLVAIASCTSLIVIYGKIGCKLFTHFRNFQTNAQDEPKLKTFKKKDSDHPSALSNSEHALSDHGNGTVSTNTTNTGDSGIYMISSADSVSSLISNKHEKGKKKEKTHEIQQVKSQINRKIMHKFTLMFMLITFIFLMCYIPKVIIMFFEARNPKFWEQFSDKARAGMLFVYRMFVINNISNPFIYAFLDAQFRQELKDTLRKCRKC